MALLFSPAYGSRLSISNNQQRSGTINCLEYVPVEPVRGVVMSADVCPGSCAVVFPVLKHVEQAVPVPSLVRPDLRVLQMPLNALPRQRLVSCSHKQFVKIYPKKFRRLIH